MSLRLSLLITFPSEVYRSFKGYVVNIFITSMFLALVHFLVNVFKCNAVHPNSTSTITLTIA